MNSIAPNQKFVKNNLPHKITSKVEANKGHTRFILVDKYIQVRIHHKCFKMRVVILTDKENTLYQKIACLNNPNFFTGQSKWPVKKIPANQSQMRDTGRCHCGYWAPNPRTDTAPTEFSNNKNHNIYVLGYDSEWQEIEGKRHVLSYQLSTYIPSEVDGERDLLEFILFPEGHRLSLDRLLSIYAQQLNIELGIDIEPDASNYKKPVICYLIPHYSVIDLTTFQNSLEVLRNTDTIRRSQTTVGKPYFANIYDRHYNYRQCWAVHVRDTMHLSPAGSSLDMLARAMNKLKLELPETHSKDNMARFLEEEEEEYILYACNDATLTLQYIYTLYPEGKIPTTLGAEGAEMFRDAIKEINDWMDREFDYYFRGLRTVRDENYRKKLIARPEVVAPLEIASHAYYGGRNETYLYGIHHSEEWTDYDLTGAYPTAMAMLGNIDFDKVSPQFGDIITIDRLSYTFGLVDFEFPENVAYPCLPIKDSEGRGLVFPRKGRTFASAPELYAALRLGARLRWVQVGYQIGTTGEYHIQEALTDLLKQRAEARKQHGKGSIQEVRLKEMINSIYGKCAQGLSLKRNYSTRTNSVEDLPPSAITQPIIAMMTTGIVRAIVSIAMNQLHALGYKIVSVTTDGFLANAPENVVKSLNLFGFKAIYEAMRSMMVGDPTMWEVKHRCKSMISIKTRGAFGLNPVADNKLPIAKAGYKPEANFLETYSLMASAELARRFLERTGKIEMSYYKLPSPRDYVQKGADGVGKLEKKRIDWEYDLKRKPTNIRMESVMINDKTYEHVSFDTEPWDTYFDFVNARAIKKNHPELYPMKDVERAQMLMAMIRDREAAKVGRMVIQSGERGGIFRTAVTSYIRDLMAGREQPPDWMKGLSYKQLAEAFNERLKSLNVKLSVNDFKNAKRRKESGRLPYSEALDMVKELLK